MDPTGIAIGFSNIFTGGIVLLLALPLLRGSIKPNHLYGVRFAQAFASDQAWYEINRYGARRLIFWSIPVVLLGVVAIFLPLGSSFAATLLFACAPLIVVIPAIESWRFARRYPVTNSDESK